MSKGFSGKPLTRWNGTRDMTLEEDFYYIDGLGKKWLAKKGSCLNGATIPRFLWSAVGSPYTGKYRRASIIHDVAIGELCNPDVSKSERKKGDRMFYSACRHDGCSRRFAAILYIGVRFGSWSSKLSSIFKNSSASIDFEEIRTTPESQYMTSKFWSIIDYSKDIIENDDLDALDLLIEKELGCSH